MIRIILKESASKVNDWEYGAKHIRFLKRIRELAKAVSNAAGDPDSMFWPKAEMEQWLDIIESIRPLKNEHIVKVVGFGARGGAFLLTNGNILKVGLEPSGAESLEIPKKLTGAQFSGKGSAGELHVYDSGTFYVPGSRYDWAWREVPVYTTFGDWARKNIPNFDESLVWNISSIGFQIRKIMNDAKDSLKRTPEFNAVYRLFIKNYSWQFPLIGKLSEENTYKLIKAFYDINIKRDSFSSLDLHDENLGVDQHGNFVFFDF